MLVVTILAVCLAVGTAMPCFGVTVVIVAVPTLMRTAMLTRKYRTRFVDGINTVDRVLWFIQSLILASLIGVPLAVAFAAYRETVVSLFLASREESWFRVSAILIIIVGTIVAPVVVFNGWRAFWPRRRPIEKLDNDRNGLS